LKALFDLSFTRFVSTSIAKIVYVLVMIGLAVLYVVLVAAAFMTSTAFGVFMLLVGGPLTVLIYLCLTRLGIESLIATIRVAENTAELVRLQHAQQLPPSREHG
jgi:hypothetical protein